MENKNSREVMQQLQKLKYQMLWQNIDVDQFVNEVKGYDTKRD